MGKSPRAISTGYVSNFSPLCLPVFLYEGKKSARVRASRKEAKNATSREERVGISLEKLVEVTV